MDPFASLWSFVHHVLDYKVTKSNPISVIRCRPICGHNLTCISHLRNARSWLSDPPPFAGRGRTVVETVSRGGKRVGLKIIATVGRDIVVQPASQPASQPVRLSSDQCGAGHVCETL